MTATLYVPQQEQDQDQDQDQDQVADAEQEADAELLLTEELMDKINDNDDDDENTPKTFRSQEDVWSIWSSGGDSTAADDSNGTYFGTSSIDCRTPGQRICDS